MDNTARSPVLPSRNSPGDFVIWVRGWLDSTWFDLSQDLLVTSSASPDQVPVTCLRGRLPDQSALIGVLVALDQFGLVLISVQREEPNQIP